MIGYGYAYSCALAARPALHASPPCFSARAACPALPLQALAVAQRQPYHALQSNCIAFADYAVRVLTGGRVRSAPLIFDLLVGQVGAGDTRGRRVAEAGMPGNLHDASCGPRIVPPPPIAPPVIHRVCCF